jgi:hypothetical protein
MGESWPPALQAALALLPPLLTGPAAAIVYVIALKKKRTRTLLLFWALLLTLDAAATVIMTLALGDFIGPGDLACLQMPLTALVAGLILIYSRRRLLGEALQEPDLRRWYLLGAVLIPFLQLAMMLAVVTLGPLFCELGLRSCSDW